MGISQAESGKGISKTRAQMSIIQADVGGSTADYQRKSKVASTSWRWRLGPRRLEHGGLHTERLEYRA